MCASVRVCCVFAEAGRRASGCLGLEWLRAAYRGAGNTLLGALRRHRPLPGMMSQFPPSENMGAALLYFLSL